MKLDNLSPKLKEEGRMEEWDIRWGPFSSENFELRA